MNRFLEESSARDKNDDIDEQFSLLFTELSGTVRDSGTLGEISVVQQPSIVERSSLVLI
jgi:hypothetical protein